jgi:hypothetical protein
MRAYNFAPSPREQFFTKTAFAREMRNGIARRTVEAVAPLPIKYQTSDLDSGFAYFQSERVKIPERYPLSSTVRRENSRPR